METPFTHAGLCGGWLSPRPHRVPSQAFDLLNRGWKHCLWTATSHHPDYPFKESLPHDYVKEIAPLNTSGKDCQE